MEAAAAVTQERGVEAATIAEIAERADAKKFSPASAASRSMI
jgi:AcrR family transcriptional regulator